MSEPMTPYDEFHPLPTGTMLLEASAGTGKTHQIARLVCRFVAETDHTIDQFLLVTFGASATLELQSRVFAELSAAAEADSGNPRLRAAVEAFDEATIATTHTFCSLMLDRLGVLANWDADAQFTGNLTELVADAADDVYVRMFAEVERPPFSPKVAAGIAREAIEHADPLYRHPEHEAEMAFAEAVRAEVALRKQRWSLYTYDDLIARMVDTMADPTTGAQARRRLSETFPVVLVDEFQDTDPAQWGILRDAFVGASTVVLIGDPKQSIYGFRNADLNAYLEARGDADTVRSLATNWRSDPAVVAGVGALFEGAELGHRDVVAHAVSAAPHKADRLTDGAGNALPAVRIRRLPMDKTLAEPVARAAIEADVVDQVSQLVRGDVLLDQRPVRPDDIAILVRTRQQARSLMAHLSRAGIAATAPGIENVFGTEASADWRAVLAAWQQPSATTVRAAALSGIVGVTGDELVADTDGERLADVAIRLRASARMTAEHGVAAGWESLKDEFGTEARLIGTPIDEQRLTDLGHLAELLADAAWVGGLGIDGLASWLASRIDNPGPRPDNASRRLSTDADAVHLSTTHGAKGLQYPIVLIPHASQWSPPANKTAPFVVTADGQRRLFVGASGERAKRRGEHLEEVKAEELRLLYVAFTRAESGVIAWWAPTKNTAESPLHRVLSRTGPGPVPPKVHTSKASAWSPASTVTLETVHAAGAPAPAFQPPGTPSILARDFTRHVDMTWRRTSYSGLTADAHDFAAHTSDESELDELGVPSGAASPALAALLPLGDLPGGVGFGSLVHLVLEYLDWSVTDVGGELDRVFAAQSVRQWLTEPQVEQLTAGLLEVLATPLGALADDLPLGQIPVANRLAELDFDLPLGGAHPRTVADLAAAFTAHTPSGHLLAGYGARLAASPAASQTLHGFLTGSIDAVLQVSGRYLVVDYKTNRMPTIADEPLTVGHYRPVAMAEAMMASHYPLQALLYSVALHRFLSWRLPGYDPAAHLGGAGYLFVRGMIGADTPVVEGMPCGVFTWRPSADLVLAASRILGGDHA